MSAAFLLTALLHTQTPALPAVPPVAPVATVQLTSGLSVDQAVERIAAASSAGVVLDTGESGEDRVREKLTLPPDEALQKILPKTLGFAHVGAVLAVGKTPGMGEGLQPSVSLAGKPALKLKGEQTRDEALSAIFAALGMPYVLDSGEAGDAQLRLKLEDAPAQDSLAAVLHGSGLTAHQIQGALVIGNAGMAAPVADAVGLPGNLRKLHGKISRDDALKELAHQAGLEANLDTDEAGDALLLVNLDSVPMDAALSALLGGTHLAAVHLGNTLHVGPRTTPAVAPVAAAAPIAGDSLEGFEVASGKRFTGDFKQTPVMDALRQITDAAGLSLLTPGDLPQTTLNAHLQDVSVEDALRAVCAQAHLHAIKQGAVVTARSTDLQAAAPAVAAVPAVPAQPLIQHVAVGTVGSSPDEVDEPDESITTAKGDHVQSGDVTVNSGDAVGDVVAFHGNATLSAGAHARSVTALGGDVDIASGAVVEHDVAALGGTVHVRAGAKVGGQASSLGGKVVIDPGAQVHGDQTSVQMPSVGSLKHAAKHAAKHSVQSSSEGSVLLTVGWMLALFALYFSLGLILIVFYRAAWTR